MGKYQQDAQQLLEAVGGKENIAAVSHCVTRMRFVLNDPAKADVPRIERTPPPRKSTSRPASPATWASLSRPCSAST